MKFIPLETEIFTYQHLLDSDENLTLIKDFKVKEETGKGLENYLKNVSEYDERTPIYYYLNVFLWHQKAC